MGIEALRGRPRLANDIVPILCGDPANLPRDFTVPTTNAALPTMAHGMYHASWLDMWLTRKEGSGPSVVEQTRAVAETSRFPRKPSSVDVIWYSLPALYLNISVFLSLLFILPLTSLIVFA